VNIKNELPSKNRKEIQSIQYKELSETIKIDFIIQQRKQHPKRLTKFIRFLQFDNIWNGLYFSFDEA
jgi:hypothetical protein